VERTGTSPIPTEEFIAFPSPWRIALLTLAAGIFVALGLWMVGVFGPPPESPRYSREMTIAIGWAGIIFFGLCGAVGVRRLFDGREQLRIGSGGIRSVPWSDQTIPWSEIDDVKTWSYKGQRSIILHLRDPAHFPGRGLAALLGGANRKLTGGDVAITLTGTDRSFDDAMSAIARFRPASGSGLR
jgi:hypothetical protein